jgi:polysaccharide pyruvyl transferase WcaK-like protein
VAIIGPYTTHNFGDDLIGATLAHFLLQQENTQVLLPGLGVENCQWLGIPSRLNSREALASSQAVLIGGGGILGDSGVSPSNRHLSRAAKAALFSRATGRPVAVTAVGAGPLALRTSRLLCRTVCRLALAVGVRDQSSADFLIEKMGVPADKVIVGADVALLWPQLFDVGRQRLNAIGVQFDVEYYPEVKKNPHLANITERMVRFCVENDSNVILVSNSGSPTQLHRKCHGAPRSLQYWRIDSFLPSLASLRAIVTSHLHLAIAAYAAGVPCFSIYVREKTKRFYDQIGHPDRALDLSDATPDAVEYLLGQAQQARWTTGDSARLGELRNDAQSLVDICSLLLAADRR